MTKPNRWADPADPEWLPYMEWVRSLGFEGAISRYEPERQEDFNCWKDLGSPHVTP